MSMMQRREGVLARIPRAEPQSLGTLPAPVDLVLYRGDTFWFWLVVTDEHGQAPDWDSPVPAAQIRPTYDSAEAVDFVASIEENEISLLLTHEAASELPPRGVWDVQVTLAGGIVTTLAGGTVTVMPDVTR